MLQINKTIRYSKHQKAYIKWLWGGYDPNAQGDFWEISNGVLEFDNLKKSIRLQLLIIQRFRCAYCQASLLQEKLEVDHFAPKSRYQEFSFIRTNLFLSCGLCNSSEKKGDFNTIAAPKNSKYSKNHFKLVHPYHSIVAEEIKYVDPANLIISKPDCSGLGIFTVWKFDLDSERMMKVRHYANISLNEIQIKDPDFLSLAREVIMFKHRVRRPRAGLLPDIYY